MSRLPSTPVTRRDFHEMEREHYDWPDGQGPSPLMRFYTAVYQMTRNGTFYDVAWIHRTHCAHGVEAFGTWHRAFLVYFESLLRRADMENGNDGDVGLPYWDWENNATPRTLSTFDWMMEGERFDLAFRGHRREQRQFIEDFARRGQRHFDRTTFQMGRGRVDQLRRTAQNATTHFQFVTNYGAQDLESLHDEVHVRSGNPMGSVEWAAFDLLFWLHHCNVDRWYQAHIQHRGAANVSRSYRQGSRARRGAIGYSDPLRPFSLPDFHDRSGEAITAADCITEATTQLGFRYEALPSLGEVQSIQQAPVRLVIPKVKKAEPLAAGCTILAFVRPREMSAAEFERAKDNFLGSGEPIEEFEYYGGKKVLFLRAEPRKCKNCTENPFLDISIDVAQSLAQQGLSRDQATFEVMATQSGKPNELVALNDIGIRSPVRVYGQAEESALATLKQLVEKKQNGSAGGSGEDREDREVALFQAWLKKRGLLKNIERGDVGRLTQATLDALVEAGLVRREGVNMFVTEKASALLEQVSYDSHGDHDAATCTSAFVPGPERTIKYFIAGGIDEMTPEEVRGEIRSAQAAYEEASQGMLKFEEVDSLPTRNRYRGRERVVVFAFSRPDPRPEGNDEDEDSGEDPADRSDDGDAEGATLHTDSWRDYKFDGVGQELAHTKKGAYVHLDGEETWLPRDAPYAGPGRFYLFPVLLHEIGHLLGLGHSQRHGEVMSPFYDRSQRSLTPGDVAALRAMLEAAKENGPAPSEEEKAIQEFLQDLKK